MKKLALVLSFVFCAAMIAPAFAQDKDKKPVAPTECTKDGKACSKDCKKACCAKDAKTDETKKSAVKK